MSYDILISINTGTEMQRDRNGTEQVDKQMVEGGNS